MPFSKPATSLLTTMAAIGFATSLALTGCQSSSAPEQGPIVIENPAEPIAIVSQGSESDEGLVLADVYYVSNARQLKKIPADLSGITIDFDTQELIVVALGQKPTAGYGVTIDSIQKEGGTLVVNIDTTTPAEGEMATTVLTYPYAYAVIEEAKAFAVQVAE